MSEPPSFDRRHPIAPRSWEDVYLITKGRANVSIQDIECGRIDHEYDLDPKDLRPCGRLGCRTPHAAGSIVALAGGGFTNIGHVCVDRWANKALWGAAKADFRARRNKEARDRAVLEARDLAQRVLHYLDTSPRLVDVVAAHANFLREAKGPLLEDLERRAERGNARLEAERRIPEDERQRRRALLEAHRTEGMPEVPVPHFEAVLVGEIGGLRLFRSAFNPVDLGPRLNRLAVKVLVMQPENDDVAGRKRLDQAREELQSAWRNLERSFEAFDRFYTTRTLAVLNRHPLLPKLGIRAMSLDTGIVRFDRKVQTARRSAA